MFRLIPGKGGRRYVRGMPPRETPPVSPPPPSQSPPSTPPEREAQNDKRGTQPQ